MDTDVERLKDSDRILGCVYFIFSAGDIPKKKAAKALPQIDHSMVMRIDSGFLILFDTVLKGERIQPQAEIAH